MKKWLIMFVAIFTAVFLMTGCSQDASSTENNGTNTEEVDEDTIVISITKDEETEVLSESVIEIEEGDYVMDVMKENFTIEEEDGFIYAIDDIAPAEGEEKAWIFYVNGEMASVGAEEYELSTGDYVVFDLQPWE